VVGVCFICVGLLFFFFFNDTATTEIYTLSLHDALPIYVVDDLAFNDDDFAELGLDYERDTAQVIVGRAGQATARLMRMRPLVDYAVQWMERNRH